MKRVSSLGGRPGRPVVMYQEYVSGPWIGQIATRSSGA